MLFCKPSRKASILYEQAIGQGQTLAFRSLRIPQDLFIFQHWASPIYWKEFWLFPHGFENITDIYRAVQKNPDTHCIVSLLDEELIGQIDLYKASSADLGKYLQVTAHDTMIRFQINASTLLLQTIIQNFQSWYFAFPQAGALYADPGIQNNNTCRMLEATGFVFHRNLVLSQKAASIYILTKKHYSLYLGVH